MRAPTAVALAALWLAAVHPTTARAEPAVLRVSAIPDEAPTELQRKFKPLGEYLARALGLEVRFVPVSDYPATVEALASGQLDLVWFGGFTFVQARRRTGDAIPLVQREEDARFHSKFITRPGSGIRTLADLKGKTFAFGSPSSTSGHLMPRFFMLQEGIDPERDLARFAFSGAHDVTARWVESGKVDAGALNESVWQKLVDEKKIDPTRVVVFHTTPAYHDYNWTVRGDLDPKLVERLRAAFLALDPARPEHKAILDLQRATRFIPTSTENYRPIEEAARAAGLLK
ncbi:MAG TPA: putative selenate ABC transporter substrate-binding protein [Anaeromyxobacteraceae bacterium]|nr:putative selenate ABC transporter substrate-binding protein [Anaeromyxobacteraceae bacterium]